LHQYNNDGNRQGAEKNILMDGDVLIREESSYKFGFE